MQCRGMLRIVACGIDANDLQVFAVGSKVLRCLHRIAPAVHYVKDGSTSHSRNISDK